MTPMHLRKERRWAKRSQIEMETSRLSLTLLRNAMASHSKLRHQKRSAKPKMTMSGW